MTRQEIFETVARHLFKQGRQSKNPDLGAGCMYRGPDGTMCAIGALIPDEVYHPCMEGSAAFRLVENADSFGLPQSIFNDSNSAFLSHLQVMHDASSCWESTDTMRQVLGIVASNFNLDASFLEELSFNRA